MHTEVIFGVSEGHFIIITLFWIVVLAALFGFDCFANGVGAALLAFFILGTAFIIGNFGWQIFILPSLVILSIAVLLFWKFFLKL